MYARFIRRVRGAAFAAVLLVVVAGATASLARGGDSPPCPSSTEDAYRLKAEALTGKTSTDVSLVVTAMPGCAAITTAKHVRITTFDRDGSVARVVNLDDVAALDGVVLDRVDRGLRIETEVLVQTGTPPRTYVLRSATTSRLRPDLVVKDVQAAPQTLTTRPIDVAAQIDEINGDTGAVARVRLLGPLGPIGDPVEVTVAAGAEARVTFRAIALTTPVPTRLTVVVADDATPEEYDTTNNDRSATVDVTEHQLAPGNVLFPSLLGYGAQFGNHLYAPITPWPAGVGYGDAEAKVKALEPQLVRIFYNDNWDGNWDTKHPEWQQNYDSFVKVAQLAQDSGATIEVSFQNLANARLAVNIAPSMAKFADVLDDLVRNHGLTNVRWAEVGNEPNSGAVTLDEYDALYRALNAQLVDRGLRGQIHLMGGGLVENAGSTTRNHYAWMQWIAANMGDVVDAYAEHIYWTYNDQGRLEYRLRDTYNLMRKVIPPEQRKPLYMMEFGIRGFSTCGTKPPLPAADLGYYRDASCTDIWRTNIAAFQQLWFDIDSAQLGVAGTSKWDAYWSRYDNSSANNQFYWMVGPPTEGSPVTPTYAAMSLLFHTTAPGWQIIGVEPWQDDDWSVGAYGIEGHSSNDQPEQELAAYAGPNGELTLVGLDTNGRDLNSASTQAPVAYSIGGLPANASFNLAEWNATGDGADSVAGTITTNAVGVARFQVPLQAAFSLTSVPVG